MARILILGYGNPLRSDDGLGWKAAEDLSASASDEVEVRACFQLLPEVVELVSRADTIFFIDAAHDGEPGEVKCAPVVPERSSSGFSHQLSPGAILDLSSQLYGRVPKAFMMSICGDCFELGETLSPVVAASLPRLTGLVRELASHLRC
jgi:hydrogenase maturation protease